MKIVKKIYMKMVQAAETSGIAHFNMYAIFLGIERIETKFYDGTAFNPDILSHLVKKGP